MNGKQRVFLKKCQEYSSEEIGRFLDQLSGFFPFSSFFGKKVLLKPNLIGVRKTTCSCTHPIIITSVASWLMDMGARVAIGDSPAFGSTASVLKRLGIEKRWLARKNIEIKEFRTKRQCFLQNGVEVVLAAETFDCDLLVNLPKIKAHDQLYVTMAVKNFFGTVKGFHKAKMHMVHGDSADRFASILLGLPAVMPPHVTIGDGIEVMHRHGPLGGEALSLGVLVGAQNPLALDTAMLNVLELDGGLSPLHRQATKQNIEGARLGDCSFPLEHPASFHGSGFIAPKRLNPIRFHPFRFLTSSIKRLALQKKS